MSSILASIADPAAGARAKPGRKTNRTARPAAQPADRDKVPAVCTAEQWQPERKRAAAAISSLTISVVSLQLCRIKLRSKEWRNAADDIGQDDARELYLASNSLHHRRQ
jgi:hypothetical protein